LKQKRIILIASVVTCLLSVGVFLLAFFQFARMTLGSAIAGLGLVLLGLIPAWGAARGMVLALTERRLTVENKGILYVETFGRSTKEDMIDFSWISSIETTESGGLEVTFKAPGTRKWKVVGLMESEISDALLQELEETIGVREAY
jgi:hypothetical protein